MPRAYKTEIHPTLAQAQKIRQSIGNCRFLYNRYVAMNEERYQKGETFLSGFDFDIYVNHELSRELPWIKRCGSKARKKVIMNAETAYKRFFKGMAEKPKFKKKHQQDVKMYFPKNNKGDLKVERHRIKVPTLGWVRLKEKGYIPIKGQVSSCTIEQKENRYYISVLFTEVPKTKKQKEREEQPYTEGIGIDVGLKDFATLSQGKRFQNINKSSAIKRTEKRLKRAQRALSRKYESKKKRGEQPATNGSNIRKNVLRVQKLHQRLARIRDAYRAWVVSEIVKTKPSYITIEHLNVKGMMKNKHLAQSIANQGFYDFKQKLMNACLKWKIELREVALFYPSSKLCSCCGYKRVKLSLSERIFHCDQCGHTMDRDLNASINLAQVRQYAILT